MTRTRETCSSTVGGMMDRCISNDHHHHDIISNKHKEVSLAVTVTMPTRSMPTDPLPQATIFKITLGYQRRILARGGKGASKSWGCHH